MYIGVSRHEIHGVQVAAFALVWKDSVHPEYDEAIVSRNADALSDEDVALRVSVLISTFIITYLDLIKVFRLLCMRSELQIQEIH